MYDSNHIDDFEEYLQHQVNDHRMYPSDRVWQNIRGKINTPKRWPALSVFAVLIISGLIIGTILNKPVPDSVTPNFVYSLQTPVGEEIKKPDEIAKSNNQFADNNYSVEQLTSRTINDVVEKIKIDQAIAMQLSGSDQISPAENNFTANVQNLNNPEPEVALAKPSQKNILTANADVQINTYPVTFKNIDNYLFDVTSRLRSLLSTGAAVPYKGGAAFFISGRKEFSYDNNFDLKVSGDRKELLPSLNQLGKTSSRFDFRFYVTPSVSYRRLKESDNHSTQKDNLAGASLESDFRIDPSVAINHSAAIGYETGVGLGYKLSNKFVFTGGFQFNVSQYKINAFLYKDEPTVFTLNEGAYSSTVNTISSLRSVSGTKPLTIKNRYYQLSMPVGLEWNILNRGKFNWGVGTSIQPTYTFDKQPLIISSNYKNYADGSAYVRNWNVNANLETFFGYTTGGYRWQLGPQLRYQMLPSLVDRYPNKEYLINYGLKIGVVKQLK